MIVEFFKYQGAGNDFILIDNRKKIFPLKNYALVERLCHRRFGIGADGLILLQSHRNFDFEMIYYNADGKPGSMCGNGGRCVSAFAQSLKLIDDQARFLAADGAHAVRIGPKVISLEMQAVNGIEQIGKDYFLNTGSPHYVRFVNDLAQYDVDKEGKKIRYNARFKKEGTNVNFIELKGKKLHVRTYERGVEAETLSCGTGVTASALVVAFKNLLPGNKKIDIQTPGGALAVSYQALSKTKFSSIVLHGPAEMVYSGHIEI